MSEQYICDHTCHYIIFDYRVETILVIYSLGQLVTVVIIMTLVQLMVIYRVYILYLLVLIVKMVVLQVMMRSVLLK